MSATIQSGTFAGMTHAQLEATRGQLQRALLELATGAKVASVSYAQGNGSRSVSYTAADETRIRGLIRQINAALGQPRRAIGVVFR